MAITWLHISDLHRGQRGDVRWATAKQVVLDDIAAEIDKRGRPDLILFTGDLAFAGTEADYHLVDDTLNDFYKCIGEDVLPVVVPGNHDLTRPHKFELAAIACKQYFDSDARLGLREGHKSTIGFFSSLFANYSIWWERSVLPKWKRRGLKFTTGLLPGDFVVSFEKDDLRIGIAGLNSAFLHFGDIDESALSVEYEQLGRFKELSRWRLEHDASLLLMHHPKEWLDKRSRKEFLELIYPGNSFVACCFGHMHEEASETVTSGGSERRRWLQAASLFGLEKYGKQEEARSVGYTWCRLERIGEKTGRLTRWPRVARRSSGSSYRIFDGDIIPYPQCEDVALNERRPQRVCRVTVVAVPSEFPFVEHSLLRRIEELRTGLVCTLISAESDAPRSEQAELTIVLVGGLLGKGTTLVDVIKAAGSVVFQVRSLESRHSPRADWDPKGLALLIDRRSDLRHFENETELLGQIRPVLDKVCKQESMAISGQINDPFTTYVVSDLEVRRQAAQDAFAAGEFERALLAYEDLSTRTAELRQRYQATDDIASAWSRSTLNVAACHLALRNTERAREVLASVEVDFLNNDAREIFAIALVNVREMERAEVVARSLSSDAGERVKQLIAISLGQAPASKPEAGDQLIYAAQLLLKEGRFHTALDWIKSALPRLPNKILGELVVLEALANLVEEWVWAEEWSDPLTPVDAETLIESLEGLLSALQEQALAAVHRRRVNEIEYSFAIRTDDKSRLEKVRASIVALGADVSRSDKQIDDAIALGRAGDVATALATIGADPHLWRGRLRQVGLLSELGDVHAALDASLRLAEEYPGRLMTEYEATRQLMRAERYAEAAGHARAAFVALPAYGPRVSLAEVLLFSEQYSESAALVRKLADRGDSRALLVFAQCMERLDTKEAIRAWRSYVGQKDDLQIRLRIAGLELRIGRAATAADDVWSLVRRTDIGSLTTPVLYQFALLQAMGAQAEAHARVTEIAQALKNHVRDPSDELLYLQLWSWLRGPSQLPSPDFDRLLDAGAIQEISEAKANEAITGSIVLYSNVLGAFHRGHLSFEVMLSEHRLNAARYMLALGDGEFLPAVSIIDPDVDDELPQVGRVLVSEFELLLCQRLGLLDRFLLALSEPREILIFADVYNRFLQVIALMRLGLPSKRMGELQKAALESMNSSAVRVVDTLPEETPVIETLVSIRSLVAWLHQNGSLSRARARGLVAELPSSSDWRPKSGLAVNAAALRWFVVNDLVTPIVEAMGAPMLISKHEHNRLRLELDDASLEVKALELCERTLAWVEARLEDGKVKLIPRPEVDLPQAKMPSLDKMRSWIAKALSWRVAADANQAHCFTVDTCARDLFSSIYLPQILHSIQWSESTYRVVKHKFQPLRARMLGMSWLASLLDFDFDMRATVAAMGAVDALDASTIAHFQKECDGKSVAFERAFSIAEAPLRDPQHSKNISATLLIGRAYAAAVKILLEEPTDVAARFVSYVLARLNDDSCRGVAGLLSFVLPAAFAMPIAAYLENLEQMYSPSLLSNTGRLFQVLVDWAKENSKRLALLQRAAADVILLIDESASGGGPSDVLNGVIHLLASLMPSTDQGIDLMGELMSALTIIGGVWNKTPLMTLGTSIQPVSDPDAVGMEFVFEDILREGVSALEQPHGPELNPLYASWEKEVLGGRLRVRVPVEAIVLRAPHGLASDIAQRLAVLQGPRDGAMYAALRAFAEDPADFERRRIMARRAIQSPWKQIFRDPTSLLRWGHADALHTGAPVVLKTILEILSEPSHPAAALTVVQRLELYLKDIWKDRDDQRELFLLAAQIPGIAGMQVARVLADDPQVEDALSALSAAESVGMGSLWCCLMALWIAAVEDGALTIDKVTISSRRVLEEQIGRLIAAITTDPERGTLEAQLLLQCRRVVGRCHPPASDLVWLVHRLFGWVWNQMYPRDPEDVRNDLRQLTPWVDISTDEIESRDPMDPASWSNAPDLRLVALMNVLALSDVLPIDVKNGGMRWLLPISAELHGYLVAIASKEFMKGDRELRDFRDSTLQWLGSAMPQENALCLLLREPKSFVQLDEATRLRWLQELPNGTTGHGIREEVVTWRLLVAAARSLTELSDIEIVTLSERLVESTSPLLLTGTGQAIALLALQTYGLVSAEIVWPRIRDLITLDAQGAAIVRLFADALVKSRPDDINQRLQDLMNALRGPSDVPLVDRIQAEPVFADEPAFVASLRQVVEESAAALQTTHSDPSGA